MVNRKPFKLTPYSSIAYTSLRSTNNIDASGTQTDIFIGYSLRDFKCPYTIAHRNLEVFLYDTPWDMQGFLNQSMDTYGYPYLIGLEDLEISLYNRLWDLEVSFYNRTWGLTSILIQYNLCT